MRVQYEKLESRLWVIAVLGVDFTQEYAEFASTREGAARRAEELAAEFAEDDERLEVEEV